MKTFSQLKFKIIRKCLIENMQRLIRNNFFILIIFRT